MKEGGVVSSLFVLVHVFRANGTTLNVTVSYIYNKL